MESVLSAFLVAHIRPLAIEAFHADSHVTDNWIEKIIHKVLGIIL